MRVPADTTDWSWRTRTRRPRDKAPEAGVAESGLVASGLSVPPWVGRDKGDAMPWTMKLRLLESCSCAQICPCILGPAKPDQEWCSGVFGMEIAEGSGGVNLSGAKIVMHFELPGDFISGIDKAKLY